MNEKHLIHLVKTNILGVHVTNAKKIDVLEFVVDFLLQPHGKLKIFTPNPEMIVAAHKNPEVKNLLNQAQISLADGVGVLLAGLFLGHPFQDRIPGADFLEIVCKRIAELKLTVGFLGAKPGVAERAAECLIKKYPGLKVGFIGTEWPVHISSIPHTDILFVAFGFPKQEKWIAEHLQHIPVTAAMAVGGALDYISGDIRRAPFFIRSIGLEWLYRLIRQPWRIKRQFTLFIFVYLVLQEKVIKKRARPNENSL